MLRRFSLGVQFFIFFTLSVSGVLVSACEKEKAVVLPTGLQTLTGTILPTDISLLRRGTHLFSIDDKDVYFLESTDVNLGKYENKRVVLLGEISANVDDSYLPLLTVVDISDVLGQTLTQWKLHSLDLHLALPDSWGGSIEEESAMFIPLGTSDPIISFQWIERQDVLNEKNGLDYISTPLTLDSVRAKKIIDEHTGNEIVHVSRLSGSIIITFHSFNHPHAAQWHEDWLTMLSSITFNSVDVVDPSASSGSVSSVPCGGSAGILCPNGFYCDVVNLQENIGICKSL